MNIPTKEELKKYEELWIEDLTQQQIWSQFLEEKISEEDLEKQIQAVKSTVKAIKNGGASAFVALEKDIIFKINNLCIQGGMSAPRIYLILRAYVYSNCGVETNASGIPIGKSEKTLMKCINYECQILRIGREVISNPIGKKFFSLADDDLKSKLVNAFV
ncbi:hypothetical protein [Aquamicrobium sp.]|uniref:hypothetical protein n=1 Tax=Aquamicrobium sp. TaxID=1872579 RepID=UPI002590DC9A|nr:hypothetical protein [Aquamicrobium sp.]MCK9549295.1 hypothetical protein [Aquamicrobium sp.]